MIREYVGNASVYNNKRNAGRRKIVSFQAFLGRRDGKISDHAALAQPGDFVRPEVNQFLQQLVGVLA